MKSALLMLGLAFTCAAAQAAPKPKIRFFEKVPYTSADWPETLHADIWRPASHSPAPAVVLVHGGAWKAGNRTIMRPFGPKLAAAGFVAMSIDYRLAPRYPFPAALQDLQAAVRWLRQCGHHCGVDPNLISAWGYSAGAHLATLLGVLSPGDPHYDPLARLSAVIGGGTPADLADLDSQLDQDLENFLGGTLADHPEAWRAATPLNFVSADDAPMLLYHAERDRWTPVDQARRLEQRFRDAGVPIQAWYLPNDSHQSTLRTDSAMMLFVTSFLGRHQRAIDEPPR